MMQKYQDSSLSPEERASDLLARMNLDEKFGQIQCYNAIDSFLGKSVEKQNPYGVGQVCILIATMLDDVGSAAGLIARLQKQIMESGKHHIPAIFHIETLTGVMVTAATSFPCGLGQASNMGPGTAAENGSLHCPTGTRYGNQSCAGSCVRYLP